MFEKTAKLISPDELKAELPVSSDLKIQKQARDKCIKDILAGIDKRKLMIVGPCSVDNEEAVCIYVNMLAKIADEVKEKLFIVPRLYTTKPRSKGNRYRGMLHSPDSVSLKTDFNGGLRSCRQLMLKVFEESGFSGADEMLYPGNYQYFDDLLSYVTVGSRSSEDQQHRLVASGFDVAVGIKNPMSGHLMGMLNSISVAQLPNELIYNGYQVKTSGNPYAHAVLRGRIDTEGALHSNYSLNDIVNIGKMYRAGKLKNPAVIVDANHANSNKVAMRQAEIIMEVIEDMKRVDEDLVKGFMVESYLVDGAQYPGGTVFGQSITDACIGIEKTKNLIYKIAESL